MKFKSYLFTVPSLLLSLAGYSGAVFSAQKLTFSQDILPIFEAKCLKCHSDEKQKGELRLDTKEWILKGGESGDVLIPFKPEYSDVYVLAALPDYDPDYMPSKGKGLTPAELETLRSWIQQGAQFEVESAETAAEASMDMTIQQAHPTQTEVKSQVKIKQVSYQLKPNEKAAIEQLKQLGVKVDHVHYDQSKYELILSYAKLNDDNFPQQSLIKLADRLTKIDFARLPIGDASLASLTKLSKLSYLDLRQTKITDKGLAHLNDLPQLEYLNLYGTSISDHGLAKLNNLTQLKSIYLTNTRVTQQGIKKLVQRYPNLKVSYIAS
ncbi:c-type cytochrome domain-containing protein [Catenovulum maritimum]|uniref:Cytochrome c domain-containing protein n=1 Tax=Catenovulum maritimum TaxID=1513271 RepID=A0A0J8GUT8_9ALTE|nr:c-type cytochrome domain-containing protein [Catenovulum maritimum]KMT65054.1 hypothetical protein XM47_11300 [Catenovulum maritimum]